MADGPPDDRDTANPVAGATAGDDGSAAVGLLVGSDENRRLLRTRLGERREVVEPA